MIIMPGQMKSGIRAAKYPVITTPDSFAQYTKIQKDNFTVELSGSILPIADLVRGERFFEVDPKKKIFKPATDYTETRLKRIKDFREIDLKTYLVDINIAPKNSGKVEPSSGEFDMNKKVIFTALPNVGYIFSRWTGDYQGESNPATILIDSDKKITLHFRKKP